MASFSVTIANELRVFGPAQTTKWNSFNWNAAPWGDGTDVIIYLTKIISESVSPTDNYNKSFRKLYSFGSIAPAFEMSSETAKQGNWYINFVGPASDAEDRNLSTWTSGSVTAPAWTSATVTAITWS